MPLRMPECSPTPAVGSMGAVPVRSALEADRCAAPGRTRRPPIPRRCGALSQPNPTPLHLGRAARRGGISVGGNFGGEVWKDEALSCSLGRQLTFSPAGRDWCSWVLHVRICLYACAHPKTLFLCILRIPKNDCVYPVCTPQYCFVHPLCIPRIVVPVTVHKALKFAPPPPRRPPPAVCCFVRVRQCSPGILSCACPCAARAFKRSPRTPHCTPTRHRVVGQECFAIAAGCASWERSRSADRFRLTATCPTSTTP